MQAGPAQEILKTFVDYNLTALDAIKGILPHAHTHGAGHSHEHEAAGVVQSVDINAAWFALASVVTKEWIYRVTKKVADEEKSPVLDANAQHHRSDAYSSAVAFAAIVGTWAVPGLPLDALGGKVPQPTGVAQILTLVLCPLRDSHFHPHLPTGLGLIQRSHERFD